MGFNIEEIPFWANLMCLHDVISDNDNTSDCGNIVQQSSSNIFQMSPEITSNFQG